MANALIKAFIFDGGGVFSLSADAGGQRYWEAKLGLESGCIQRLITPELGMVAIHFNDKPKDILQISHLIYENSAKKTTPQKK